MKEKKKRINEFLYQMMTMKSKKEKGKEKEKNEIFIVWERWINRKREEEKTREILRYFV